MLAKRMAIAVRGSHRRALFVRFGAGAVCLVLGLAFRLGAICDLAKAASNSSCPMAAP